MSQASFEERSKGWMPENPKTSKRKLKRMYTSAVIVLSITVLISLFSTTFIVQLLAPSTLILPPYVHANTTNAPFDTYVEFQGIPPSTEGTYWEENGVRKEIEQSFSITWNNGSVTKSKSLNISFSTNAKSYHDDNFQVHLALVADNFVAEKTLDGTMVNGKLIVNSNPSLFMIDPSLLVMGTQVQMGETPDWRLIGDVANSTWKLETAIEDYRVETIGLVMYHSTATVPKNWLTLFLGYDVNTGMLVSTQGVLSDVLFDAVGIKFIIDSKFQLVAYSENLNLEVIQQPTLLPASTESEQWIILAVTVPVVIGIASLLAYRKYRRKDDLV